MFCSDHNNGFKWIKWKVLWSIIYIIPHIYGHVVDSYDLIPESPDKYYINGWAVQIKGENTYKRAKRIAEKYGFEKVSKVSKARLTPEEFWMNMLLH